MPGSLANTDPELRDTTFFRLVGVTYFQKHSTCFTHTSPEAYYHSFDLQGKPSEEQHVEWLDGIRESIWIHISEPSHFMPSNKALRLHWYRSLWVVNMWQQASLSQITLLPMHQYGWKANGDYIWETEYSIQHVQGRVRFLTSGCGCTTSGCKTRCVVATESTNNVGQVGNRNNSFPFNWHQLFYVVGCRCVKTGCENIHNTENHCKSTYSCMYVYITDLLTEMIKCFTLLCYIVHSNRM